ncbi:MAG: hypothetical protein RJA20_763 [Bacteroidota bacterium]
MLRLAGKFDARTGDRLATLPGIPVILPAQKLIRYLRGCFAELERPCAGLDTGDILN